MKNEAEIEAIANALEKTWLEPQARRHDAQPQLQSPALQDPAVRHSPPPHRLMSLPLCAKFCIADNLHAASPWL